MIRSKKCFLFFATHEFGKARIFGMTVSPTHAFVNCEAQVFWVRSHEKIEIIVRGTHEIKFEPHARDILFGTDTDLGRGYGSTG